MATSLDIKPSKAMKDAIIAGYTLYVMVRTDPLM
jgi:hypothetical protein